ncbi:MAG TPA: hypothetical protein VFP22_03925 [Candidatus Limnocylindrales bacterium]|nr:hypothetical protein [Candidatus Limnocylindrales bacterium]
MADRAPMAGLCAVCRHARTVTSGRGSRFVLCERSRTDARFERYPHLPVIRCVGFEADGPDTSRRAVPSA